MTRATRILTATAISLMVISVAGLAVLMPVPLSPQRIVTTVTGELGGPFMLTASDGRTVTDLTYRGKWVVIYFGYTSCPDACPVAVNNMGVALDRLGAEAASWQPIFITVDPKRDTQEALAEYLKSFDPRIVGLTGTEEQIAAVVRDYRVYVSAHEGHDYLVDHSSFFYVINPEGKFVNVVTGKASGEELADTLRQMMKHTV